MITTLKLRAYGKINLALDVLRKREDGYHDVRMIMQTVGIYDQVDLRRKEEPGITVETNLSYLPVNENNLVYQAARLLMEEFQVKEGLHIQLKKFLPVAAGMAGGSSDAAAVLYGVNKMFGLGLSKEALMERGVKIGADVPYCLLRGTALSEGIGEKLTPLPPMPQCQVVIAKPGISVSTRYVYENLHANELRQEQHPDIDGIMEGLEQHDLRKIAECMGNVLEDVTIPMYPVIREIKQEMTDAGALGAMMSGSGPTVFGLFESRAAAREAQRRIREKSLTRQVYVTNIHSVRRNQNVD